MSKHSSLVVTLDGVPLVGPREAEQARLLKALVIFAGRVGFARRAEGGALVVIPDDEVALDHALLVSQNGACPPDTIRGAVATLASVAKGREDAASRPPDPRPAPPTPSESARQARLDLIRQESEAEARLASIRAARERHAQLVSAGDATGAAEVKP